MADGRWRMSDFVFESDDYLELWLFVKWKFNMKNFQN